MDVLLVNMPFAALYRPSIGLSLLKAELRSQGISCAIRYFTVPFAERIDSSFYLHISNQNPLPTDLLGEWIFAAALWQRSPLEDTDQYINEILLRADRKSKQITETILQKILQARLHAEPFLEECVDNVLQAKPRIMGFSSVFQQNAPALALAKRIKSLSPDTQIVFGGDNCEGIMGPELVRQFPFIDAAVSGEGDLVFPQIVQRLLAEEGVSDITGVYTKHNVSDYFSQDSFPSAPQVVEMDRLPYPDYDDFFLAHYHSTLPKNRYEILFESSRGCWWGERSHCTFCGLSSEKMAYRSKSSGRALQELLYLNSRYPGCSITSVDNIIDLKYFKDLVPELAMRKLNLNLFYETKANLKKDQVRLMKEAGFASIQPGIESFNSRILELMGKGVKALQNIQLLKWCKEFGIFPYWNLLWGFPGEDPEEYRRMAKLIPMLTHLPPPQSVSEIRLDRFSPNFKNAERIGFIDVEPFPAYFHVYDLPPEVIQNLAYYFTFGRADGCDPETYTSELYQATNEWRSEWRKSDLFSVDKGSHLLIWDFRRSAKDVLTVITEAHRELYLACDSIQTTASLQQKWNSCDVLTYLQPLLERGLMVHDGNSFLSLAIPLGKYSPNAFIMQRFHSSISRLGGPTDIGIKISLAAA